MFTKWIFTIVSVLMIVSCTSHGSVKNFDGLNIYYQEGADTKKVDQLGNYLTKVEFTNGQEKSLQLLQNDSLAILKLIVDEKTLTNDSIYDVLVEFRNKVKIEVFPHTAFELHLSDKYFETKVVVTDNE